MLINNAINILSESYAGFGEMARAIDDAANTPNEPVLQRKLIISTLLYRTIMAQLVINDDGDEITGVIGENYEQLNKLIFWLQKETSVGGVSFPTPLRSVVVNTSGPPGEDGEDGESIEGPPGADGAAYNFSSVNLTVGTHEINRCAITDSPAANWDYNVFDSDSSNKRRGTVKAHWNSTVRKYAEGDRPDVIGTNPPVTFSVEFDDTDIVLYATVVSGTWNINGERRFTPTNGNFVQVGTVLAQGYIFIGGPGDIPVAKQVFGVITIDENGEASFNPLVIDNTHIKADAAIEFSKMEALDPEIGLGTDANGRLVALTGAISGILFTNLSGGYVLVSDPGTGKIIVSSVPTSKLAFIANLLSDAQDQINNKQDIITGAASTAVSLNFAADKLVKSNGSGKLAATNIDVDTVEDFFSEQISISPLEDLGITENLSDMALQILEKIVKSTGAAVSESIVAGANGTRVYLISFDNRGPSGSEDYAISVTEGGDEYVLTTQSVAGSTLEENVIDTVAELPVFTETDTGLKFLLIGAGVTLKLSILGTASDDRFIRCLYADIP